jgi:hypothetical protein
MGLSYGETTACNINDDHIMFFTQIYCRENRPGKPTPW